MYSRRLLTPVLLGLCCAFVSCTYLPQKVLQGDHQTGQFEDAIIDLPLDHFNPADNRTFSNRFWVNTTFYQPGSPIFFYDAGERGVSNRETVLTSAAHPLIGLAESFNGAAVVWEHRYYGLSSPFPEELGGTQEERQEAYQYLNTEQALEDTVYFASHFKPDSLKPHWDILGPDATPWIWIGGSYPGQRGAMIRRRNPDVFFASWSSSANVQVRRSLPEYYLRISRYLPDECREVIQAFVRQVDRVLKDGQQWEKLQLRWAIARRWPIETYTYFDKMEFAFLAPDILVASHVRNLIAADWQWEGLEGRMGTTCAAISSAQFNCNSTPNSHNAVAMETILDAIEANNRYFASHFNSAQNFPLDAQAWAYQSCTEYFQFQTAAADPEDPYNILSSLFTPEKIWQTDCKRQFPWLSPLPDWETPTPAKYAGWDKNFSRVMFTTGLQDPWHDVSIVPGTGGLIPGSPRGRRITDVVPGCGEVFDGEEVFGLLFQEGRHCADLVPGSAEAGRAVGLFGEALREWLSCF